MKKLVFIILATGFITTAHAITWQRVYGGEEGAIGRCVLQTSDSGFVVTGTWSLLRTNRYGDSLWVKDYGSGHWADQTIEGGYVISWFPDLLKTDENGDSIWGRDYGIESHCVRQTSDSCYIVTGPQAWTPLVLLKIDENGDTLWKRTYEEPGNNINVGYFVEEATDSGFIITGTTGYEDEEYNRWAYLWLLKTDIEGNQVWSKTYGEQVWNEPNEGRCVRQTIDDGYIISGVRNYKTFWLLKTNENGDTIWTRTYDGEDGNCVLETQDGNYVTVGNEPPVNPWLSFFDESDILLVKVDPDGNTIWQRRHGGDGTDNSSSVAQTSDGGYIITGYSDSFTGGTLYLLKTDSLGFVDAIVEEPITEIKNWVIMNPIGPQTTLRFWNFSKGFKASIFDVAGRKADDIKTNASAGTLTWGQDFPSGVYFIQVNEANKISTAKVELVR